MIFPFEKKNKIKFQIQKPSPLKFEPKVLPFLANSKLHKAESFLLLDKNDFNKNMDTIKANTNVPVDKSAGAIKLKLHLMNYIGTLCLESSKIADAFIQIELYKDLLSIIKNGHNLEMFVLTSSFRFFCLESY